MEKFKKLSGAAMSEKEYKTLLAEEARDKVYKQREKMLKELSGATIPEAERLRLENSIPKKAKGGMSKKQLDVAEDVAESPLFPGKTFIQLRQAAKAVKKAKGGEVVIGKGGDYIKDLL